MQQLNEKAMTDEETDCDKALGGLDSRQFRQRGGLTNYMSRTCYGKAGNELLVCVSRQLTLLLLRRQKSSTVSVKFVRFCISMFD